MTLSLAINLNPGLKELFHDLNLICIFPNPPISPKQHKIIGTYRAHKLKLFLNASILSLNFINIFF